MAVKERLEQYIKEDKIYQNFIDSRTRIKDLTDFDLYCINHCSDIEEMLKKNQQLKEKFKATNKGLQKVVLKRKKWKHRYQLARCEIKELKKQLEEYKEQANKGLCNTCLPYTTGYNKAIKDKENQQKEFIKYLEDEIENSTFLKPSLKMILQKYKEIVNGDDDSV